MKMFTPFAHAHTEERPSDPAPAPPQGETESLAELKARMDRMQHQLERLAGKDPL